MQVYVSACARVRVEREVGGGWGVGQDEAPTEHAHRWTDLKHKAAWRVAPPGDWLLHAGLKPG